MSDEPFDDGDTPVDDAAFHHAANAAIEQTTIAALRRRIEDLERENAQLKLELRKRLPRPAIEK